MHGGRAKVTRAERYQEWEGADHVEPFGLELDGEPLEGFAQRSYMISCNVLEGSL